MHRTIAKALWFSTLLVGLGACGDGDDGGSSASGPVTLDASKVFEGNLTISGTITLPAGAGAGKSIQLTASGGGADITQMGSYVGLAGTTPGETVPYTITGLVAGEYTVRARVDQNDDGKLDSPGDLDGHYGGTVDAPIMDVTAAKDVTVGSSGATGVDFGVGPLK
jgi:hypothetical protein